MTEHAVFAPGRVNLIGEHTDYSGGLVLPVAIDLGTTVAWRPLDGRIRVRSLAFADAVELGADGSGDPVGWARYASAVARLLHDRGRPDAGIDAVVSSTLPIGSGLSSSAALTVSLALALSRAASFDLEPFELARVAQEAERLAVGVPCGLMDPACILLARRDHAFLLDCGKDEYRHVPLPKGLVIVVIDSGVRHALETSLYAERRREVEQGHPRRQRHVSSENERVRMTAAALEAEDFAALGSILRRGQESLRDDFDASTPELDLLVDLAYAHGAVAARTTGGGFGGSIVVLAETGAADTIAEGVVGAYQARTGIAGRAYICSSVDGAAYRAQSILD